MSRRRIEYSVPELRFIYQNRGMGRAELHAAFIRKFKRDDVAVDHIKSLCCRNGWTRVPRWDAKDAATVKRLYADTSTAVIARRLGRTVLSVYQLARKLGLKKSAAYMARQHAVEGRRLQKSGKAHRFKKGQAPANKGKKMPPGWAPGRMRETQFRKGERTGAAGQHWRPIGSEREVGPYLYTKVADTPNVPWTRNWKATHILKWEQLHGPFNIRTHALKSKDGNPKNTEPSNWELIPRAMLPRLNGGRWGTRVGYDQAPAELRPSIMAVAKVEHAIAQRDRREGEPAWKATRRRKKQLEQRVSA